MERGKRNVGLIVILKLSKAFKIETVNLIEEFEDLASSFNLGIKSMCH
jgi:hypothetical protein